MFPPPSKSRRYRGKDIETPSRTPGINTDWKERDRSEREHHRREHGGITMKSTHDYSRPSKESNHHHSSSRSKRSRSPSDISDSDRRHHRDSRERDNRVHLDLSQDLDFDEEFEAATPLQSVRSLYHIDVKLESTPSRSSETSSREETLGRATPSRDSFSGELTEDTPQQYRINNPLLDEDDFKQRIEESDSSTDEFYEKDDGQATEGDHFFLGDQKRFDTKEKQYKLHMGEKKARRMTIRQSALQADQEKWENLQMQSSGVVDRIDDGMDEDEEQRIMLIVLNTRPPFLSGTIKFTRQKEMVSIVKDPTNDFAKLARLGSPTLKAMIIDKERERIRNKDRFWDINASKMGKTIGLRQIKDRNAANDAQTDEEMRKDNSYAQNLEDSGRGVSDFARTKTIQEQREFLPIFSVREELMNVIRENQVVVIVGETGSGKTTQLTQYLYEEGYANDGIIGCMQPRRVAASSVAKRVANEKGGKVGDLVGYAIRFEDCTSPQTRIKYMTYGILLRESISDPMLEAYSVIIMDEAHERSLDTDVLFGIMKKVVQRRTDLKLIITSATMNSDRFSDFFGSVPIFTIPGRTFPVQTFYQKSPPKDYVTAVVNQILMIHLNSDRGDILVFMTGQADIDCVCDLVNEKLTKLEKKADPLLVLPMYSLQSASKQALVFKETPEGYRKCVVCTNIAETSLTVDGIKYVVDSGFCKLKVFNPSIGMDALQVTPVSRANADQRAGRAGRTGPGVCFRMYTEYMYAHETLQNQVPEIQRTNLGNVVLLLKKLGIQNLYDFDFMDPPPEDNITNSMYQLWVLGALTNTGALSEIGDKMVQYPLDPYLQKMMVMAEKMGCTAEIVVIVAMLSVPNIFDRPVEHEEEADSVHENFSVPESDHLTYLNVFLQWKRAKYSMSWCEKNYIHGKSMMRVRSVRNQLLELMKQQKIPHVSCGSSWDVVRKCICSAYFFNAARIKGIGSYTNMLTGTPCQLHPSSALYSLGYTPDYVVYHELVMTTKEYMHCVTAVDAEWLAELAPMFFQIKENPLSRLKSKKLEKRQREEMEEEMEEEKRKEDDKKKEVKTSYPSKRIAIATPGRTLQRGSQLKTPRRIGL